MTTLPPTIASLNWRYSTKVFDTTKKLTADQLFIIMEAFRLSPSSFGLQAWKFIRVVDSTLRQTLKSAAFGQSQVTDSSEFFVLCVPTNYSNADVDKYISLTAKTRNQPIESLSNFKEMLYGYLSSKTPSEIDQWLRRQVYIALGQVMAIAAFERIDTCPLEGFEKEKFDDILNLKSKNLTSVVCLAVGFRSSNDKHSLVSKVRYGKDEIFLEV